LQSRVELELEALTTLQHENILSAVYNFESEKYYNIVTQLCEGDLLAYINENGRVSESEARNIIKQLISAMNYAWNKGFCHRDIKLDNIMLKDGKVYLGDWGFATKINTLDDKFTEFVGSIPYECPQIILSESYKGTSADIWSMGVVLYALVTGELPFKASNNTLMRNIVNGNYTIPEYISTELASLIVSMLEIEESDRITVVELQNHSWLIAKKKSIIDIPIISKSLEGLIDIFRAATISPRAPPSLA